MFTETRLTGYSSLVPEALRALRDSFYKGVAVNDSWKAIEVYVFQKQLSQLTREETAIEMSDRKYDDSSRGLPFMEIVNYKSFNRFTLNEKQKHFTRFT